MLMGILFSSHFLRDLKGGWKIVRKYTLSNTLAYVDNLRNLIICVSMFRQNLELLSDFNCFLREEVACKLISLTIVLADPLN